MDINRQIELLYDALKHEYTVYIDDVLKSIGFLVLGLGWLVTSDKGRQVLHSSKILALLCVLVLCVNSISLVIGHYVRSRRLQSNIRLLTKEMDVLIRNYSIVALHMLVTLLALMPLYAMLVMLIWKG